MGWPKFTFEIGEGGGELFGPHEAWELFAKFLTGKLQFPVEVTT